MPKTFTDIPEINTSTEGALINGATAKTTPVDADYVGLMDSAASNVLKKLSWANIKVTLKAYFDTLYLALAGGTMTGDITLGENTSVALDPSLSADGKYTGLTISGTAGAALAFGDVIVLDVTAGKWLKADISAAAGADGDSRGMIGICVLAAAGDADPTKILLQGVVKADANFPAFTTGVPVYASTTGDVVTAQPVTTDYVIRVLGFTVIDATSATAPQSIYFNPSSDYTTHI